MVNPYGIEVLWQQSDIVIKSVAFILLFMSLASWAVLLARAVGLLKLRFARNAVMQFWHAKSLEQGLVALGEQASPFKQLVQEGQVALQQHQQQDSELQGQLPLNEWMASCLRSAIDDSSAKLQAGMTLLASVGSTAPFIGLFGTVWGIYHALVKIGTSGSASIDKIAGPVGEALIMTAFGLAVAIPAVLAYNTLARANKNVLRQLNRFAHQLHGYFLTGAGQVDSAKSVSKDAASSSVKTAASATTVLTKIAGDK